MVLNYKITKKYHTRHFFRKTLEKWYNLFKNGSFLHLLGIFGTSILNQKKIQIGILTAGTIFLLPNQKIKKDISKNVNWSWQNPVPKSHLSYEKLWKINRGLQLQGPKARFVKVYCTHKLCRNVLSHNSGIFPSNKGCENAECHFINQVQECQNFPIILWMVPTTFLTFNDIKSS